MTVVEDKVTTIAGIKQMNIQKQKQTKKEILLEYISAQKIHFHLKVIQLYFCIALFSIY